MNIHNTERFFYDRVHTKIIKATCASLIQAGMGVAGLSHDVSASRAHCIKPSTSSSITKTKFNEGDIINQIGLIIKSIINYEVPSAMKGW